ncbi:hypothetical protein [Anaeromyxobacter paludicola]|uniref:Uncharacterized protein n=1 Tax=Anaeromyxobacter paludicola TaxID=2918171 RepID=A0ABM7XCQ4_9BACT|nr:hypothetical protein [Anaeromyxobacter paludicola]BDG09646.1 hypothetical protein AMPC_27590 [Anaeromyxobacter paludicola]
MISSTVLPVLLAVSMQPTSPNLPVFGGGKLVNIFDDDAALTNASAHVAWSLALPLGGYAVGGRRGMWIAGLSWIGAAFLTETFFHAPPRPGAAYPSEVRADLLTKVVPCAAVLAWDLLRARRAGPGLDEDAETARKARERLAAKATLAREGAVGFPEGANALLAGAAEVGPGEPARGQPYAAATIVKGGNRTRNCVPRQGPSPTSSVPPSRCTASSMSDTSPSSGMAVAPSSTATTSSPSAEVASTRSQRQPGEPEALILSLE